MQTLYTKVYNDPMIISKVRLVPNRTVPLDSLNIPEGVDFDDLHLELIEDGEELYLLLKDQDVQQKP